MEQKRANVVPVFKPSFTDDFQKNPINSSGSSLGRRNDVMYLKLFIIKSIKNLDH